MAPCITREPLQSGRGWLPVDLGMAFEPVPPNLGWHVNYPRVGRGARHTF
jgi:hypothetical protein